MAAVVKYLVLSVVLWCVAMGALGAHRPLNSRIDVAAHALDRRLRRSIKTEITRHPSVASAEVNDSQTLR